MIGHGDGLGPNDHKYKLLRRSSATRSVNGLWHHSSTDRVGIANSMSQQQPDQNQVFRGGVLGEDREWLIIHCQDVIKKKI